MLSHYLTITIRILWRNKGYSLLNILGLTIGMTCAILIGLYIQDEFSYDRHHEHADRIFRIVDGANAKTPTAIGSALQEAFPEVVNHVWMMPPTGVFLMRYEDRAFYEYLVYRVDKTLLDVFTLPLVKGDPRTALEQPYSVIISETAARKYFGDDDPIGRVIDADDGLMKLTVTGVMRDMPPNSHLMADFFISDYGWSGNWAVQNFYTYILLSDGDLGAQLEQKLPGLVDRHRNRIESEFDLRLQRLTDIHLYSHLQNEPGVNSDIAYIYILAALAGVLLLIACINFMNLATARSATRGREVGMRKVVGADRRQLIFQFLGESVLFSLVALALAVVLALELVPGFNAFTGKQIDIRAFDLRFILMTSTAMALVVGIVSGSYPALFLSAFDPITVLKGHVQGSAFTGLLRRGLVVAQFSMAIGLMVGVGVLYQQLLYIQNARLGLQAEQLLVLPGGQRALIETYGALKEALLQHPGVLGMTTATTMPGRSGGRGQLPAYLVQPLDMSIPEPVNMPALQVGLDFTRALGLELAAGRDFSSAYATDAQEAVLLNETGIRQLGWPSPEDALGRQVRLGNRPERAVVVGVVKDFHMNSFHKRIEPLIMTLQESASFYGAVRISPDRLAENLAFVEQTWNRFIPVLPFSYTFLDEDFAQLYHTEERLGQVFGLFTVIAIVIACLGLLGLAAFMAERRTKEIGVRKVLGASIFQLAGALSKEFIVLVFIANGLAWPIAYLVMARWLESFAYRIDLGVGIFLLSGAAALLIALATVSYHAIKAATANPVETLRSR